MGGRYDGHGALCSHTFSVWVRVHLYAVVIPKAIDEPGGQ